MPRELFDVQKETIIQYRKTEKMSKAVTELFDKISVDTSAFDCNILCKEILEYISRHERLMYSIITNLIFECKEEKYAVIQTNLDKMLDHVYGDEFNEEIEATNGEQREELYKVQKFVLKLWDHVNLAKRQYSSFKESEEGYYAIVDKRMAQTEVNMTKEMNTQLISLVSIFTALSFILFGGITSLDNIFSGAKDIPITKLMITGTIWCFCIMNLVFVFMFFVAKMTKLDVKSTENINANIVQRYPLICWCNLFLVSLLVILCWINYVRNADFRLEILQFFHKNADICFVIGSVAIVIFIGLLVHTIVRLGKGQTIGISYLKEKIRQIKRKLKKQN